MTDKELKIMFTSLLIGLTFKPVIRFMVYILKNIKLIIGYLLMYFLEGHEGLQQVILLTENEPCRGGHKISIQACLQQIANEKASRHSVRDCLTSHERDLLEHSAQLCKIQARVDMIEELNQANRKRKENKE